MVFIPTKTDEFDEKDVALLTQLIRDCRTPASQLAEAVELSVSATTQRIARLEERGIIKSYKLVLNHGAFPYDEFDITYTLTDVSAFTIESAMKYLAQSPFTTQVLATMGAADIRVTVLARSSEHLGRILDEAERHFASNIRERTILAVRAKYKSAADTFLSALFLRPITKAKNTLQTVYEEVDAAIDRTDIALLKALAHDPRASYASLASTVQLTPEGVSNRVKSLEKRRIITGYTTLLDGPRLGYRWGVLRLQVRQQSSEDHARTLAFIQSHQNISSAVETLGAFNLTVTFFGQTLDAIRQTELDFRQHFGDKVVASDMLFILENHKYPEIATGMLDDLQPR